MYKNILIVDDLHPVLFDKLHSSLAVDYKPDINFNESMSIINKYHGLIIRSKFKVCSKFLSKAKNLEFIARAGSGIDNIDEGVTKTLGISILNASEANKDAVAEHTLGLLLSLLNNICTSNRQIHKGQWIREANRGHELNNKTVGIIGYGHVGSSFAKLLSSFNLKILAHDKYKFNFSNEYVRECSLKKILEESDIISLHIPLTDETHYYIDSNFFYSLRKPIWLINTSRGKTVNINALLKAINNNKILGAALDVLEEEPPMEAQWFKDVINHDKIILTAHTAGWTHESYRKISEVLADKINKFYNRY